MDFLAMLQDIYMKYGFSSECGISVVRQGKAGAEEIQAMMKAFRANPPKELGGSPVTVVKDYASLELTDLPRGHQDQARHARHQQCAPVFHRRRHQGVRPPLGH